MERSLSALPAKAGKLVTARTVATFHYACPHCMGELTQQDDSLFCSREGRWFRQEQGIWRLLRRERVDALQPFLEADRRIRDAEGWDADAPGYYLALPFRDTSRRHPDVWRVRAAAFRCLDRVLAEQFRDRPVRALDLGAGNCWLTRQLAAKGYAACALDIRVDAPHGLGAGRIYREALGCQFERVQAEPECLPFVGRQFELVLANASLHASENIDLAVDEACRVLVPGGIFVVLGSPFYRDAAVGGRMLAESRHHFQARLGVDPALWQRQAGYLTYADLPQRLRRHGLELRMRRPFAGLRWWLRPWIARLRRRPELASFPLAVCRLTPPAS